MRDRKAGPGKGASPALSPFASVAFGAFADADLHYYKGVIPFMKRYVIYPFPGKRASLVVCICKYQNRVFALSEAVTKEFFPWR